MDDQVQNELADLLRTGGRSLCTTPRMLSILLRERCPQAGESVGEIEQAMFCGCVRSMLETVGPIEVQQLAGHLVAESGMPPGRAQWVIEAWVLALAAADTPQPLAKNWSSWNRLDVSAETAGGDGSYRRAIEHLIMVGLAGAFGGATFGFYCLARGDAMLLGPWRDALEDLEPWVLIPALLSLGILGGFAGALLGWIFAGGRSWTHYAHGGTTLGRLVLAMLGAFHGAATGVMTGLVLLGLIGVMVGALVGALIGAILGLLVAEVISRLFW